MDSYEESDQDMSEHESNLRDEMASIQSHLHGQDNDNNDQIEQEMNDENQFHEPESHVRDEHSTDEDDEEDDEEEDNVQITIGDIDFKTPLPAQSGYLNLNLQKGGRQFAQSSTANTKNVSKTALDLDAVGTLNGVQIYDVNLDSIEDKPWRKPGSDITDYFNYGFTEETWKVYCERQRKIRSLNQNGQFDVNSALNMTTTNLTKSNDREPLIKSMPNEISATVSNNSNNFTITNNQAAQPISSAVGMLKKLSPSSVSTTNRTSNKLSIDVITQNLVSMLPTGSLLSTRPNGTSSQQQQSQAPMPPGHTSDRSSETISVIGNRTHANLPFPPPPPPIPPPPFGFPPGPTPVPHDAHSYAGSIRAPLAMLPPTLGPNGQPMPPFCATEFAHGPTAIRPYPTAPPGSGILPHPVDQRPFEDFDERRRRTIAPGPASDFEEFERDRENRSSRSDRYRSSTTTDRDYEEQRASSSSSSSRHYHERDRDRKEHRRERSRDGTERTSTHETSSRSRSSRDSNRASKDKDRHRDRDHRDKLSSSSHRVKSSSKHESSSTSSSDHHKHRSSSQSHSHSSSNKSKSSSSQSKRSKDSSRKDSDGK